MEILENWYVVAKSRFDMDLSMIMPYSVVKRLQNKGYNVTSVLIGYIGDFKVIIDKINNFDEIKRKVILNNGKEINLGKPNPDMFNIQEHIINGYPIVYNWSINKRLYLSGIVYHNGDISSYDDEIIGQNMNLLRMKYSNEVFVVWSSMSPRQKCSLEVLSEKELDSFCPDGFADIKNCKPNLFALIEENEERKRKEEIFNKIDVPWWMRGKKNRT